MPDIDDPRSLLPGELNHSMSLCVDGSSGAGELEKAWLEVAGEVFELWKQRQIKYGVGNIAQFGELGCLIRGYDKMARLRTALIEGRGGDAIDESVGDSWFDLVNYSLMAIICRRGQWPGSPEQKK